MLCPPAPSLDEVEACLHNTFSVTMLNNSDRTAFTKENWSVGIYHCEYCLVGNYRRFIKNMLVGSFLETERKQEKSLMKKKGKIIQK